MSDDEFTNHPLEEVFDIEGNSTALIPSTYMDRQNCDLEIYDNKDKEIEDQYQEIYNIAMRSFADQAEDVMIVDPKYRARSQEVALQYLQAALNATKEKANLKQTKEKTEIAAGKAGGNTINNNVIMDRNDMLRLMKEKNVDVEDVFTIDDVNEDDD